MALYFLFALLILFVIAFGLGLSRARSSVEGDISKLHSRPIYHGGYLAFWTCLPALIVLMIGSFGADFMVDHIVHSRFISQILSLSPPEVHAFFRDAKTMAQDGAVGFSDALREQAADAYRSLNLTSSILLGIIMMIVAAAGFFHAFMKITPTLRSRHVMERVVMAFLILCSVIAIFTTLGIILSLIFESLRFFQHVSVFDFLFGLHWSPQTAIRADQVGSGGEFGAIPLLAGTMLITAIAIFVAAPIGLLSAIYLSDYASPRFRSVAKPILEILAGIPTVVYGFFAALTVAPFIRNMAESIGMEASSESALAAGLVMGIMIIPFISSLSDDVINAVPQALRDGSAGLGATKSETIRLVILPAALPGIISALILAISRAIGETMIVVMAAGLAANLTINPLEAVTTVTVQIVTLLVGDQEFDSAKTLAAFALGLMLFCVTLILNFIALRVVQKYKEQYD